jgi:mannan endo-1,4-beta-mannosidase
MKPIINLCIMMCIALAGCTPHKTQDDFVRTSDEGYFLRGGKPYYYIGTNFWYGAILGSTGEGGNRDRLHRELDLLKELGVNNLRVLVGADGENGVQTRVEPSLQPDPGVYNDTVLDGLDYFMNELRLRDMTAVLYLNNSWEWSGGYSVYLQWSGHGQAVVPAVSGWQAYNDYVKEFVRSDSAQALFARHVDYIVTRTNRYSGLKYTDDPTLMSWQVGNEPRAFAEENKEPFARWLAKVAGQLKTLDPHHLVSVGSEGLWGCEGDISLFERIHSDPHVDYLTVHIWPYNWGWVTKDSLAERLPQAKKNTQDYINQHLIVGRKLHKPVVIEEFGFPRDGFRFAQGTATNSRDAYYDFVFDYVGNRPDEDWYVAGCNFWAWGGLARQTPGHVFWQRGDDYAGDPAQEEQGLNSVYAVDSTTLQTIRSHAQRLSLQHSKQ